MVKILFKHDDFVVTSKPAGLSFHNESGDTGYFNTVRDFLKGELYPVHRLDRITSGLIVFARSKDAANRLSLLFRNREFSKYYIALSDKKPLKKTGRVSGGMEKARNGQWKLNRGQENHAVTFFYSQKLESGSYFFVLKPVTGRTHQIRVAMKSLGSPIIGDPVYSSGSAAFDRGYLHSWYMEFRYKNRLYTFTDYPDSGTLFVDESLKAVFNKETEAEFLTHFRNTRH